MYTIYSKKAEKVKRFLPSQNRNVAGACFLVYTFFMVKVKRIYDLSSPEDGKRILVDKLWPRGIKLGFKTERLAYPKLPTPPHSTLKALFS